MARLLGEVEYLRHMMESMKRIVGGLGLEESRRNRGSSGRTGISGGEVRRSYNIRQQLDRRKPEWKGDSGTHFVRRGTDVYIAGEHWT